MKFGKPAWPSFVKSILDLFFNQTVNNAIQIEL